MSTLASIAPNLVAEVGSALISEGRGELVSQLEAGIIERCTYDESVDAGYVYFVRPAPSLHFAKLAAPVAETIPFLAVGFNIDVDHDGYIFGIEFLDRADFLAELRGANVL
jgi:uncharacterized protein YuzE